MAETSSYKSYRWVFWMLALCGFAVDQASKYGVFGALYEAAEQDGKKFLREKGVEPNQMAGRYELIDGMFRLRAAYTDEFEKETGMLATLRTVNGERLPVLNRGALFGFGGGDDGRDANHIFLWISLIAAVVIGLWTIRKATAADRWLCVTLGLILAGTLGNLYDRVVFSGVRDFLYWYYLIDWPVFNMADVFLVCGAGLLLIQALFTEPVPQEEAAAENKTETSPQEQPAKQSVA